MNKNIWFLHYNEIVKGPFSTEKVLHMVENSEVPAAALIWWKGSANWLSLAEWQLRLDQILQSFKSETQKSFWYLDYNGTQSGPFAFSEIKEILQDKTIKSQCHLWTSGQSTWKRIFELPEMIEELGIEKRNNFRAPIKGELSLQKNGRIFETKPGSISSGGIGFKDLEGIQTGDILTVALKSPMLVGPIHTRAKVVYTQNNGFTGLQFLNLQPETQSTIIDYIKQFQTTSPIL